MISSRQENDANNKPSTKSKIRACQMCGEKFSFKHQLTKYCSTKCCRKAGQDRYRRWIGKESGHKRARIQPQPGQMASRQMNDGRSDKNQPSYEKNCAVCEVKFLAQRHMTTYCSLRCSRAAWRRRKKEDHAPI